MKAFLIDPFQRAISAIETDGSLEHLRWLTGANCLSTAPFDLDHDLWVDDIGLMVPGRSETMQDVQRYFILYSSDTASLFAGRAILLGLTADGGGTGATVTLELVQARIKWPKDQYQAAALAEALWQRVAILSNPGAIAAAGQRDATLAKAVAALDVCSCRSHGK